MSGLQEHVHATYLDCCRQVHTNTLDLAAVSPFFYKALSSGKVEHLPARPPLPGANPASRLVWRAHISAANSF